MKKKKISKKNWNKIFYQDRIKPRIDFWRKIVELSGKNIQIKMAKQCKLALLILALQVSVNTVFADTTTERNNLTKADLLPSARITPTLISAVFGFGSYERSQKCSSNCGQANYRNPQYRIVGWVKHILHQVHELVQVIFYSQRSWYRRTWIPMDGSIVVFWHVFLWRNVDKWSIRANSGALYKSVSYAIRLHRIRNTDGCTFEIL